MSPEAKPSIDAQADTSARIEVLLVGMNGDLRGKMIPIKAEDKVWKNTVRLPASTQSLDIWGDDNDDITRISLTLGDPDGICVPHKPSLTTLPWDPRAPSRCSRPCTHSMASRITSVRARS